MTLKTAISPDHGNALDVDAVVEVAEYFDYETDEAAALATTMATTIRDEWRPLGQRLGMTASDVRAIAPAMENPQVDRAFAMATATVPEALCHDINPACRP